MPDYQPTAAWAAARDAAVPRKPVSRKGEPARGAGKRS